MVAETLAGTRMRLSSRFTRRPRKLRTTASETRAFAQWARLFTRHRTLTLKAAKDIDPQQYEHLQNLVRYSGVQLAVKRRRR